MLRDKLSLIFITGIVIAVCGIIVFSEAAMAQVTTIHIVAKGSENTVSTITFPQGAPSTTVSDPYNDQDTISDPQFLDTGSSDPVVRLKNTSTDTLTITLNITDWTGNVVVSERYELVDTTTTNVNSVTQTLSSDGTANTVATGQSIAASGYKALYLEVTLGAAYGKSGSSTLTILGEII